MSRYAAVDDDDEDECFCGCCCTLSKWLWNNGWRAILVACAIGVAVVLGIAGLLFVTALRGESTPSRWWVPYVAPLFFAMIACVACMCGGVIWILLCPARKKKRRARPVIIREVN